MKLQTFASGFLAGAVVMGLTAATMTFTPQDPAEMEKMMQEAMEKYMIPADEHAELAKREGAWNAELKMWQAPGAPYETMEGTSEFKMIMDGRYLMQSFKSDYMGMPFEGAGLTGYDRMGEEYQAIWIDNMSTSVSYSSGKEKNGACVLKGKMADPMVGKHIMVKTIEKMVDDNTFVMEMYKAGPGGKDYKTMEITYTRAE